MNCNRLSVGALLLVLIASVAGVAMTVKGVAITDAWSARIDAEFVLPSAISPIKMPGAAF
jgi:hypothetical protein